jgi:hypothetical protein
MTRRIVLRVELLPGSKANLDAFCDRTGMTKVAAVSRLIDWFCHQNDMIQALVQGLVPKAIEADVAGLMLRKLSGNNSK